MLDWVLLGKGTLTAFEPIVFIGVMIPVLEVMKLAHDHNVKVSDLGEYIPLYCKYHMLIFCG